MRRAFGLRLALVLSSGLEFCSGQQGLFEWGFNVRLFSVFSLQNRSRPPSFEVLWAQPVRGMQLKHTERLVWRKCQFRRPAILPGCFRSRRLSYNELGWVESKELDMARRPRGR